MNKDRIAGAALLFVSLAEVGVYFWLVFFMAALLLDSLQPINLTVLKLAEVVEAEL